MSFKRSASLLFFLLLAGVGFGQQDVLEKRISVDFNNLSLSEALDFIATQSDISFSYSTRSIPINKKISLQINDGNLREVLDEVFLGLKIEYLWTENKMILRKERSSTNQEEVLYTISGYIRDLKDGETLIGATVLVNELASGTITNPYGFYSISLPEGRYTLKYSFVGYEIIQQQVSLNRNINLDFNLNENTSLLEEIIITPNDSIQVIDNVHSNVTLLPNNTILQKPSVLGEPDVVKSLDVIPGIQLFKDGSTFFNVRGGARDQNQMLVDEAPIYNPAHLLGLFSSFIPESIKDLKIYKGNASAEFGGRISSVMDIKTKDGDLKNFHLNGRIGLISNRFSVEGPLKKNHSSFFLSNRRSHVKGLIEQTGEELDEFYFSDFTGKLNLGIDSKNRLYLSVFSGNDEYLKNEGLAWENKAGTIRWNHVFNDRLFSNTTLYSSKYEYRLIAGPDLVWVNHISNASLKTDFTLYRNPSSTAKFGFKLSGHNFNPGNLEGSQGIGATFVPKRNASEFSLYYSNEKILSEKWLLTYGARLSSWTNFGRTIEYEISPDYQVVDSTIYETREDYNEYSNLEPRLSLTHILSARNFLKFNYSRSAQYINLISNSISPFNNLEVWLPASVNIQPQLADQVSVGWTNNSKNWQLNLETYYKAMQNQLDYVNQAKLLLNSHLEAELRSGSGTAYGVETMLVKKTGRLTGSVSYTYSRSKRKIDGINNGRSYSALSDRPHQFVVNAIIEKNKRTTFSGTVLISSGSPLTTPTSFYHFSGRTVPVYSEKNNSRLPTYHRFDVAWKHRLNRVERKYTHFLSVSIFNFYGQRNTILESYNKVEFEDGQFKIPTTINGNETLTPTRFFVYQVVPSISYTFQL